MSGKRLTKSERKICKLNRSIRKNKRSYEEEVEKTHDESLDRTSKRTTLRNVS